MITPKNQKLVNFLFEMGSLRKIARSHRQRLLTDDLSDNIASHSHRVTIIGWFLAVMEKADPYKVVALCTFHDTTETRSNDINWVHKKYVKVFDNEIIKDQLEGLVGNTELRKILDEYNERKTLEAKVAKDADSIDQLLLCKEYAHLGNEVAKYWIRNQKRWKIKLFTKSAKSLVSAIFATRPDDWTEAISTQNRR